MPETMAAHRAQLLLSLLPNALSFGFTELEPVLEPLKVMISPLYEKNITDEYVVEL